MLKIPFEGSFPMTQDWNDPRYRSSYTKFGLLGHNGQDFGVPVGTPILAPHSGRVIEANYDATGYGYYVKIENDKEGSILGHFKESPSVNVGDTVKQGQQVGLSGNTGNSTGPHLHWGYYRFPRKRDNGFSGTVDQTHWLGLEDSDATLQELIEMRASRDKWKTMYDDFTKEHIREIQSKNEQIETLQTTVTSLGDQVKNLRSEMDSVTTKLKEDVQTLESAKKSLEGIVERLGDSEADSAQHILDLQAEIKKLKEKLKKGLDGYTFWDFIIKFFRRNQ